MNDTLPAEKIDQSKAYPPKAYLFLAFSLAVTLLWPLKPHILCPYLSWNPFVWFCCLGMVALSIGRFHGVRHPFPAPELVLFLCPVGTSIFLTFLKVPALDELLLAFDRNYGYFEMPIARVIYQSMALDLFFRVIYLSLMLAIALLYLALPTATARKRFVGAVVLVAVIILPMFAICPGAGPVYLLKDGFPGWASDMTHPQARILSAPLNTTPSGHLAWAILVFWFARKYCRKTVQIAAGIFMAGTCIATLTTGEHYIIDLVLAVPLAAGIWALVHRQWRFAGISMIVVLAWLLALREGWALTIPPVLVWILTGMTIAPFALDDADHELHVPVVQPSYIF